MNAADGLALIERCGGDAGAMLEGLPVRASQTRAVPSSLAVTTRASSGLNAAVVTRPRCSRACRCARPKRFMFWGRFDSFITTIIPAKDLRTQIRLHGFRKRVG